jgi:Flp pilus assembly protein CpaB
MRRGRTFLYLLLILVIGGGMLVVFAQRFLGDVGEPTQALAEQQPQPTPHIEMVDVVVVTQRVARGQTMNESVLSVIPYQRTAYVEGMLTNMGDAHGRQARLDLEPGFVLTSSMLADSLTQVSASGSDAALLIPRGMVAVSIPISRLSSISYAPQRGDHVNVIVTMLMVQLDEEFQTRLPNDSAVVLPPGNTLMAGNSGAGQLATGETLRTSTYQILPASGPYGRAELDPFLEQTFYVVPSEAQRPRLVSQSLIQDVIVLHVGDFNRQEEVVQTGSGSQSASGQQNGETLPAAAPNQQGPAPVPAPPPPPDVITLIVTPQDAVALNYLMYAGAELTLALRGVNDDSRIQTEAVVLPYLLEQYNIPIPIKLPYGMEPRLDVLAPPALPNDLLPTPVP